MKQHTNPDKHFLYLQHKAPRRFKSSYHKIYTESNINVNISKNS